MNFCIASKKTLTAYFEVLAKMQFQSTFPCSYLPPAYKTDRGELVPVSINL